MKITDKRIIKALQEGKCIRRKVWRKEHTAKQNCYCDWIGWHEACKSGGMIFRLSHIKANDWEIV